MSAQAVVRQIGGKWIAYYGPEILANGWEPYDQPSEAAYMPLPSSAFERVAVNGGGELWIESAGRDSAGR